MLESTVFEGCIWPSNLKECWPTAPGSESCFAFRVTALPGVHACLAGKMGFQIINRTTYKYKLESWLMFHNHTRQIMTTKLKEQRKLDMP
jgi:hypothetical protein